MSAQESSYAPKSPDLSSFYSGASDIPQSHNTPGGYPFHPGLGVGIGVGVGAGHGHGPLRYNNHNQPQPHQYGNTYQSPAAPAPAQAQPTSAPAYTNNTNNTAFNAFSSQAQVQGGGHPQPHQQPHPQPQSQFYAPRQQTQFTHTNQPPYTLQHSSAPGAYYPPFPESTSSPAQHEFQAQRPAPPTSNSPAANDQADAPGSPSTMPPRKIAPAAKQTEIEPSPVRTKFPTARIKRIMQADEEVGKVAQQTPIAVGKALELFMVQLVRKSAEVAREKNSKRITAPMLKQAIDSANEWDFLQDIVAKVSEEKEGAKGSSRSKAETDSDEEADGGDTKKKGRGGRKKKAPA
ncbi:Phosphatidylinositol 4-kinase pik1alpha (PI4-kinase)(PtdIns-4-kinase) [Hypoxylon texense]